MKKTRQSVQSRWWQTLLFCLFFSVIPAVAQRTNTGIEGVVVDSISGDPLPYVTVVFEENSQEGTSTDENGYFKLTSSKGYRKVVVSYVGFASQHITLKPGEMRRGVKVRLSSESVHLSTLFVRPKRQRYRRKNNPAVDLINRAIAAKKRNRIESKQRYQYDTYERLILYSDHYQPGRKMFGLDSVRSRQMADTSSFSDNLIFPLSVREKISRDTHNEVDGRLSRGIVRYHRGIEEEVDEGPLSANIDEIFRPIDIYDANIPILLQRIPSPLNTAFATSFYKFFIQDTLHIAGAKCVELTFVPFEPHAPGFSGRIRLALPECAVQHVELNMPVAANVNWVRKLRLRQDFRPIVLPETSGQDSLPNRIWIPDRQTTEVLITADDLFLPGGIEAHQTRVFYDFHFDDEAEPMPAEWKERPEGYVPFLPDTKRWEELRPEPMPNGGLAVYELMNVLQKTNNYRFLTFLTRSVMSGYASLPAGTLDGKKLSKVDIGPVETFLSGNAVEGFRARIGGGTTANLSQHFFLDGYLAYGFKDEKLKYRANLTYTPLKKEYFVDEYPRRNLYLTAQSDILIPGEVSDAVYRGNVLDILGTRKNTNRTYVDNYRLGFAADWTRSVSTQIYADYRQVTPTGTLVYESVDENGNLHRIDNYRTTEFGFSLRWEPMRVIYNGRRGAESGFNLTKRGPIFRLSHRMAFAGLFGSDYGFQRTDLSYYQTLRMSFLGFIDMRFNAGILWTKAPYPLLAIAPSNSSYVRRNDAFQLLLPSEFIADRWAGLHATYHLNGLILNRIPLLRTLGLREIVSAHVLWGDLTSKNQPPAPGLFIFPENVGPMQNTWYTEGSVGLENILKFLRLEYFYRFSQQNKPGVPRQGLRFGFALRF
ncbi:DUF5686 and carboxypeptidase-like regulatory domain-containing protein [Porphyromonas crevioricanis]|uniref:DUF5686 and carboxypeptidase-like regulatory domain-containing protein n=1 Tax=Porphyromonas crevioricanis TaxID=393921 RepID=UPI000697D965|nr:DUF5686 and carboxypeptidase-like regulatory domain-containing protein [Porphyromonas crevioricanis]SJZ69129.1 CarboxypepD_reg-like domain-containing protein [Porphyromonas crevioricanis]